MTGILRLFWFKTLAAVGIVACAMLADEAAAIDLRPPTGTAVEISLAWDAPGVQVTISDWFCLGDNKATAGDSALLATNIRALAGDGAPGAARLPPAEPTTGYVVEAAMNTTLGNAIAGATGGPAAEFFGLQSSDELQRVFVFDPPEGGTVEYGLFGCFSADELAVLHDAALVAADAYRNGTYAALPDELPEGTDIGISVSRGTRWVPWPALPGGGGSGGSSGGGSGGAPGDDDVFDGPFRVDASPPRRETGAVVPNPGYGGGVCGDCRRAAYDQCMRANCAPDLAVRFGLRQDVHATAVSLNDAYDAFATAAVGDRAGAQADWDRIYQTYQDANSRLALHIAAEEAALPACRNACMQAAASGCADRCYGLRVGDRRAAGYDDETVCTEVTTVGGINQAFTDREAIIARFLSDVARRQFDPAAFLRWRVADMTDTRHLYLLSQRQDSGVTATAVGPTLIERRTNIVGTQSFLQPRERLTGDCCNWGRVVETQYNSVRVEMHGTRYRFDFQFGVIDIAGLEQDAVNLMGIMIGAGAPSIWANPAFWNSMSNATSAAWSGDAGGAIENGLSALPFGIGDAFTLGFLGQRALGQTLYGASHVTAEPVQTGYRSFGARVSGERFVPERICVTVEDAWREITADTRIGVFPCAMPAREVARLLGQGVAYRCDAVAGQTPQTPAPQDPVDEVVVLPDVPEAPVPEVEDDAGGGAAVDDVAGVDAIESVPDDGEIDVAMEIGEATPVTPEDGAADADGERADEPAAVAAEDAPPSQPGTDFATCWRGPVGDAILIDRVDGAIGARSTAGYSQIGVLDAEGLSLMLAFAGIDEWRTFWGAVASDQYTDAEIQALLDAGHTHVTAYPGVDADSLPALEVMEGAAGATHWPGVTDSGEVAIFPIEEHPQRDYLAPAPIALQRADMADCAALLP